MDYLGWVAGAFQEHSPIWRRMTSAADQTAPVVSSVQHDSIAMQEPCAICLAIIASSVTQILC
jgi:hypothetical protein